MFINIVSSSFKVKAFLNEAPEVLERA